MRSCKMISQARMGSTFGASRTRCRALSSIPSLSSVSRPYITRQDKSTVWESRLQMGRNGTSATASPLSQNRHESSKSSAPQPREEQETQPKEPVRLPLHDLHAQHAAKFVPFAHWTMPVQYADLSIIESHKWTRSEGKCSVFDVSHMSQRWFIGKNASEVLERMLPADVRNLGMWESTLSAFLNSRGGIIDDCIVTRIPEKAQDAIGPIPKIMTDQLGQPGYPSKNGSAYLVVMNALNPWYVDRRVIRKTVINFWDEQARASKDRKRPNDLGGVLYRRPPVVMLAVQGPAAAATLGELLDFMGEWGAQTDLDKLYFGQATVAHVKGLSGPENRAILVSRGGYTGEDGFEVTFFGSPKEGYYGDGTAEPHQIEAARFLLEKMLALDGGERVRLAGLGARDTLRLEAGMCLRGHDIGQDTTPVEAGLSFIIPKTRREGPNANFRGAETVLEQLKPKDKGGKGVTKRRVGLVVGPGQSAREGTEILSGNEVVGTVTSGCPSPSTGQNIAMGYVKDGLHKAGTELRVKLRTQEKTATVTKMPFVPHNYYRKPVE